MLLSAAISLFYFVGMSSSEQIRPSIALDGLAISISEGGKPLDQNCPNNAFINNAEIRWENVNSTSEAIACVGRMARSLEPVRVLKYLVSRGFEARFIELLSPDDDQSKLLSAVWQINKRGLLYVPEDGALGPLRPWGESFSIRWRGDGNIRVTRRYLYK